MGRLAGRESEIRKVRIHPRRWKPEPLTYDKMVALGAIEEKPPKRAAPKRVRQIKNPDL
jgi:hypothetical protein